VNETVRRWRATLGHMLPPVTGSIALALVALVVVRAFVPPTVLRASNDAVGSYLQTLGSIYAVLLAFVVYVVWGQFNQARDFVEREASNWIDLLRTSFALGEPGAELRALARDYVSAVLEREWVALAKGCDEDAVIDEVTLIVDRMGDVLLRCRPEGDVQLAWFEEALSCFNDVSDSRTNRLANSRLRIPLAMRLLLDTGAAMTVGSLFLLAVDNPWVHGLMTATLAGAVSHILYVVSDLDNCFAGDWQAPRAPFERVQRWLASHERP
jgi:hypothetical protein